MELAATIIETSHDPFVAMDEAGAIVLWNAAAEELLGWPRDEAVGRSLTTTIVPVAYRERHDAGLRSFMAGQGGRALGRRLELPALHRDGSEIPVELTLAASRTPDGWLFHAFLHDLRNRQKADGDVRFMAATAAASADALVGVGPDFRVTAWNAAAERIFGRAASATIGHPLSELTPAAADQALLDRVLRGETVLDFETLGLRPDGRSVALSVSVAPVLGPTGKVAGASFSARDISERKRAEADLRDAGRQLASLTNEDPATGLRNRSALAAEIDRALADGAPFGVAVLAARGLPSATEPQHDELVRRIAGDLGVLADDGGEVFRVGPGAFALLLPGHDAAATAEVAALSCAMLAPDVDLAAGVAAAPADGRDRDALLSRAETGARTVPAANADPGRSAATDALRDLTPTGVEAVLDRARAALGMDLAWLSEFRDGRQVLRHLAGDAEAFGVAAGDGGALEDSYCQRVLAGELPAVIPDTARNPVTAALDVTGALGLGAYVGVPVELPGGRHFGMLCAVSREADPALAERDARFLDVLARVIADQLAAEEDARRSLRAEAGGAGVAALLAALDARDHYTGEHSQAVVDLALEVARALELPVPVLAEIEQVALLHDIGKVGIPDSVLQKRGPLNELEWEVMRQHSALGARVVAAIPSIAHLAPAIRAEHERWDGGGYPDGLRGDQIPLASRIVLACDAFHAMTSDRPYRAAMSRDAAIAELEAGAGTQFDPAVARVLARVAPQVPDAPGVPGPALTLAG